MPKNNEIITQKKFNKITIGLSSPEVILGNSRGEVLKPEIISCVMDHLVAGLEVIIDKKPNNTSNDINEDDSEIVKQIKELLMVLQKN